MNASASAIFDALPVPFIVSFVVRCAREMLPAYEGDTGEPLWQRSLASQAIGIAYIRAGAGGYRYQEGSEAVVLDGQYFDNYDLDAAVSALGACINAALNTHAELQQDETNLNLTVLQLAEMALVCAFHDWLGIEQENLPVIAGKALATVTGCDEAVAVKMTQYLEALRASY